jgi:predicted dehydrogenase
MAGGDAFFEEGIHWLHIAGSLGPRITAIQGFRPGAVARGSRPPREEHAGGVPLRQRRGGLALLLARDPVALRGLRLSKLFGREGIITFESNGLFVLARGAGLPRLILPGFRDIRGYQAMYRDFARAIREGGTPEMSLERAIEDQRLMDQVYATAG